jgi:hypothetical protein
VVEKQTVIEGALEVVEDLLHSREMRLSRIMYVEAHLLNHVGDVRPGEGKVLKSPNQVMVGSQVTNGSGHVGGDLVLSVEWCGAGLAATHANVLKYVPSVLALLHVEAIEALLHRDAKEVV